MSSSRVTVSLPSRRRTREHQTNMSSSFRVNKNAIMKKPVAPDASYEKVLKKIPLRMRDNIKCPISHEVMKTPVVAEDGFTYEYENIVKALSMRGKSPLTGMEIGSKLVLNQNLRKIIEAFISRNDRFDYKGSSGEHSEKGEAKKQKI